MFEKKKEFGFLYTYTEVGPKAPLLLPSARVERLMAIESFITHYYTLSLERLVEFSACFSVYTALATLSLHPTQADVTQIQTTIFLEFSNCIYDMISLTRHCERFYILSFFFSDTFEEDEPTKNFQCLPMVDFLSFFES